MIRKGYVLVTDRGGHLHNALMLVEQVGFAPEQVVTTFGPDIDSLRKNPEFEGAGIYSLPHLASWIGKTRFWNPFKFISHFVKAFFLARKIRPKAVVSLGAANVVPFCYWAWFFGAKVYHVECMNQVFQKSITGRLLYPICEEVYVQWLELLNRYGKKAKYAGWVL